jgi:dolichyl-diphosphooligosaccharide--protein glycosyltransferase
MEEDFNLKFDTKKLKNKINNASKFIVKNKTIFLILIPIFLSIFLRIQTYDLPITDEWAENSVENNIKNNLRNQIISQYPEISQEDLDKVILQQYSELLKTNSQEITQQIESLSLQIKENYQDESGQTYLLAIDPYHYYRQAQNYLDNGHVGDELRDGKPLDNHMLAPNGKSTSNNFHSLIGAIGHKISSLFGNDSLLKTMFAIPMIFATLAVIPLFFMTRKFAGNLGGVIASSILAIHPVFLGRTPAGFSDTDAYTILFPLIILWLFSESFTTMNKKNKLIFGGLAGFFTGMFAFAWGGWWYVFNIILATSGIYFSYLLIKYKKKIFKKLKTKNLMKTISSYILSSLIFVTLFTNFKTFLSIIKAPVSFLFLKEAAKSTLWPNVYTTVAELNEINFSQTIEQLGGNILFLVSIIGISLLLLKKNKIQSEIKYGILLLVWLLTTLYTTSQGIRFVMLVIPIFAIGIGIFAGRMFEFISNWSNKELGINKKLISILLITLILFSLNPLWISAKNTAKHEVPAMNDAWFNGLTKIKEETSENAIITSWWDFGHWFKVIADRRVTFDGASQNRPQAHWVGKALLTNNEKESIAILKMLDCGGNNAYNILLEKTNDPLLTKKLIDQIILEEKNIAKTILEEHIENAEEILENTHCNPPEAYLITSEDMVSKSGVWTHFGSWNFERSFIYNTIKENNKQDSINIMKERLDYSSEKAEETYEKVKNLSEQDVNLWIAPYSSYSTLPSNCQTQEEIIVCENGVIINTLEEMAILQSNGGQVLIKSYRDNNQIYSSEEGTDEVSIAYLSDKSQSLIMNDELLNSMFTELFYYGGQNLEHFELFDVQSGINGFKIYIWKIKW